MMNIGTKVIRKADLRVPCLCFGIINALIDDKASIHWLYGQGRYSTLKISSLRVVTPQMEQDIRAKVKARDDEEKAKRERALIYLCTNVNPRVRVSNDGHPRPMPLTQGMVVDGKCWYCGSPAVLRNQSEG